MFRLLLLSLFVLLVLCISPIIAQVDDSEEIFTSKCRDNVLLCDSEIRDYGPDQVKECLNSTDYDTPVVVESSIDGTNEFICPNRPPVFTFVCSLYGKSVVWRINGTTVASFHPMDPVGDKSSIELFPSDSDPVYNISAELTKVKFISSINSDFCVSILKIQPYAEREIQVLPFSVSCLTYCQDEIGAEICQTLYYEVVAKPFQPKQVNISLQGITSDIGTIGSMDLLNETKSRIEYYELTLNESGTGSTILKVPADVSLPYKFVLPKGKLTIANVTAVDVCGERSEPASVTKLTDTSVPLSTINAEKQQQQQEVNGLGSGFGIVLAIVIVLSIVLIVGILLILRLYKDNKKLKYELEHPPDHEVDETNRQE